jgi:hypothetical protein
MRLGVQDDLGPAVVALVEVLVGVGAFVEREVADTTQDGVALPTWMRSRSCWL